MSTAGKPAMVWTARGLAGAALWSACLLTLSSSLWADSPSLRTGKLAQARAGHTATLLADGTVLITGGRRKDHDILDSVEVFDPQTLRSTLLAAELSAPRTEHTATLVPTGELLLVAGRDAAGVLFTTELFQRDGSVHPVSATVQIPRAGHTATLLPDGRVLMLGGLDASRLALESGESFEVPTGMLYDPRNGHVTLLPHALAVPRHNHTATLLPDGMVLVTGGRHEEDLLDSAELVDPATGESRLLDSHLQTRRLRHTASLLNDGRVLLAGGRSKKEALDSVEVYDPAAQTFEKLKPKLRAERFNHTATVLPTGDILLAGGRDDDDKDPTRDTELYLQPGQDTTPPAVLEVTPANDTTTVSRTPLVAIRFSEPMRVTTLTGATLTLAGPQGPVPGTVSPGESGLLAFFVPAAPLAPGTTYTLTLHGLTDRAGNPLAPVTSRFTTAGASPAITGFAPATGAVGTTVVLTGERFDLVPSNNQVSFNGIPAVVSAATLTTITTAVPPGATTGFITITTPGGTATSATTFTVTTGPSITSFTPTSGPIGTAVMISGQNFDAVASSNQVKLNGTSAIITSASSTTITTTVPQGAATGLITVTTPLGTATSAQPFTVTVAQNFTLSTLPTPLVVPASGQGAFAVSLAGTGGYASSTTLAVTGVPSGASATFSAPTLTAGQSAFLTVVTNGTTPPGMYPLTVTATGLVGGVPTARSSTVNVQVVSAGVTTFSGRVLDEDAKPVKGAVAKLGALQVTTDDAGNFLFQDPPVGADQLFFIDGGPASTPGRNLPIIPYKGTIVAGQANVLAFPVFLHFQKTTGLADISNSSVERVVMEPEILGFEMHIPAGIAITGWDGQLNTQVSVRRVPLDRLPVPPPPTNGVTTAAYVDYFGKAGGGTPTQPVPIVYPNDLDLPPGTQLELWYYDEAPDGSRPNQWAQYGTGTVSPDGTQITPDIDPATGRQYGQPRFCCGMSLARLAEIIRQAILSFQRLFMGSATGPDPANKGGEPVDLATGLFTLEKTDIVLPGRMPITFTRTYRVQGPTAGPFGQGTAHSYQIVVVSQDNQRVLVLPDGRRFAFARQADNTFRNLADPAMQGAVLTEPGGNPTIRWKDGATWTFGITTQSTWFLTQQTDRNGSTVTVARSGTGSRVNTITGADGRQLTFDYEGPDRITRITDPIGRSVTYNYDIAGNLTTVIDPEGGITRYTYDSVGLLVTITDARNITFLRNEYSPSTSRVLKQIQADGGTWEFRYRLSGARVTGPGCTLFNPDGTLVTVARFADVQSCPTEESPATVAQGYSFSGGTVMATTVIDPRGNATVTRFNQRGYTISRTDALGQTMTFQVTATNQVESTTDPLSRKTTFEYDAAGNVLTITDPDNKVTQFEYEPTFNRVKKITDALNQVTEFTYDANGNLLTTKDPLNHVTTITYNSFGQPISVQGPTTTEPPMTFAYDTDGNLITTTDPLGNQTQRTYDAASRLTALTDPRGLITQFRYDNLNRVTEIADARNGLTRFGYDPNRNLLTVSDTKNQTTTYTYDPMDRLVTRTDALNRQESYQYDPAGNLTQFTDRKNQVSTFAHDALNRRTNASYADGSSTSFVYDSIGRLAAAEDSLAGRIEFTYDTLDRLIKELTAQGVVNYGYDTLGRRITMIANGQQPVTYGYDAASRLIQVAQAGLVVGLGYDAAGRRTSLTYPNGTSTSYSYDKASRLTAITHNGPAGLIESLSYTYDAAGNRISLTRSNGTASLLPAGAQAAYDAANEQITFNNLPTTFDANGNQTTSTDTSGTTTYQWDARNRLVAISGAGVSASFQYDALGRRISKTVNGVTTSYLYDGNDIVQEIGGGAVGASYLRSLNIDEPFVRQGASNEFYHMDALGSTLSLTNQTGTMQTSYSYEPFGRTSVTGTSSNAFQYTGRENDGTGLYYYRARYFSPSHAGFLRQDPLGLAASGTNLYAYVIGNPLSWTDPSGFAYKGPRIDHGSVTVTQRGSDPTNRTLGFKVEGGERNGSVDVTISIGEAPARGRGGLGEFVPIPQQRISVPLTESGQGTGTVDITRLQGGGQTYLEIQIEYPGAPPAHLTDFPFTNKNPRVPHALCGGAAPECRVLQGYKGPPARDYREPGTSSKSSR